MNLTKRMQQVLSGNGETSKYLTAIKMEKLGLITITDFWVVRKGVPGQSRSGIKTGTFVVLYTVNTSAIEKINHHD